MRWRRFFALWQSGLHLFNLRCQLSDQQFQSRDFLLLRKQFFAHPLEVFLQMGYGFLQCVNVFIHESYHHHCSIMRKGFSPSADYTGLNDMPVKISRFSLAHGL